MKGAHFKFWFQIICSGFESVDRYRRDTNGCPEIKISRFKSHQNVENRRL